MICYSLSFVHDWTNLKMLIGYQCQKWSQKGSPSKETLPQLHKDLNSLCPLSCVREKSLGFMIEFNSTSLDILKICRTCPAGFAYTVCLQNSYSVWSMYWYDRIHSWVSSQILGSTGRSKLMCHTTKNGWKRRFIIWCWNRPGGDDTSTWGMSVSGARCGELGHDLIGYVYFYMCTCEGLLIFIPFNMCHKMAV